MSVGRRGLWRPASWGADRVVLGILGAPPFLEEEVSLDLLFDRAERHGVAGVVLDALRADGRPIPDALLRRLELVEVARELDHRAHLELLGRVDEVLSRARVHGVVLKGPLFAERYYARPSSRATSDLDLLVAPADLAAASQALATLGYEAATGPEEERFRREHHHLHFSHREALPLELHFHGYASFGSVLPSAPLVARRGPAPVTELRALGVLSKEDELVFLAVHAAAHRFVRIGWLYDLRLLLATMTGAELVVARQRATIWGFARALAFTATLLVERMGAPASILAPLGAAGSRSRVARGVMTEPDAALLRSATRMMYTVALCDTKGAAARYLFRATSRHLREGLGLPP